MLVQFVSHFEGFRSELIAAQFKTIGYPVPAIRVMRKWLQNNGEGVQKTICDYCFTYRKANCSATRRGLDECAVSTCGNAPTCTSCGKAGTCVDERGNACDCSTRCTDCFKLGHCNRSSARCECAARNTCSTCGAPGHKATLCARQPTPHPTLEGACNVLRLYPPENRQARDQLDDAQKIQCARTIVDGLIDSDRQAATCKQRQAYEEDQEKRVANEMCKRTALQEPIPLHCSVYPCTAVFTPALQCLPLHCSVYPCTAV
eukprot:COSAG01_NODE_18866_length_1047_cov_13.644515_1_plen_259_part_01